MSRPKVSIVVPTLNSEKTINECIKSLLGQDYPKSKYEIMVVDNGSGDNTLKILEKYRDKIKVLHEPKKGSYSARNRGIKASKGEIIAFTDSDCIAESKWISNINDSFRNEAIKIVGGNVKSFKTDTILLKYCNLFCHPHSLSSKAPKPYFGTSNLAINVKSMKAKPYFDDSLKSGGDIELCLRIKRKDEIKYNPKATVKHMYSKSILSFIGKNFFYGTHKGVMVRNKKNYHSTRLPSYLKLLSRYGLGFLLIRVLQDLFHKSGFAVGYFKKAPFQKAERSLAN